MKFTKKKRNIVKKEMRLEMPGYFAKKGKFGFLYTETKKGIRRRR